MGALIRAFDWAATPLGPASAWPQALRTTLRLMLNTRHPMFLWWGPELIQFYNDALKDIIGSPYHPHALGRGGRDFLPQVWDGIIPGIEQVLAGRGATWQENQHIPIMRNGRIDDAWWTYGYTPVDDEGRIGGVLGICTETTRQVLTEQRLRAAEERNQLALEADGVVGTWMWDVPADRVHASARFARVYEVDPARAEAGAPVAEFVAAIHPEDRERVAEAIGQATAAGGNFDQEYRLVRSDGSVLWVSARGHCRLDEEGRPLRFSGILVDVTERRLAEDALRASEAKFQAIADSIDHMIWATRPDGYHDYYNQRWYDFTGAAIGSTFGEAWNGLLHPDDEEQARSIWRHSLRTGNPFRAEFRLRTRSGAFRWVLARAHAARDRQGRITRWFGTCTEIQEIIEAREVLAHSRHELARLVADRTAELRAANDRLMKEAAERERAEDALRQSQKMEAVGQLTGGIAHDFNNLLAGIAGSLELIQTRIAQGRTENLERYLSAAMGSAQRASALTHRLLAFSRRQTLDPRPTRVERLIAGMEELIRRSAGPQISLETVAAPDLWTVLCDPNQLESALLNLAINARDAMPDGGLLTVEAANAWLDEAYAARQADLAPGAYVVISITDTGAGMSADVIGRAFEPFFTTKPIGQGTGLGLSMVYGFARQSGGHVCIYSEMDQGTTVRLYLPRHGGAEGEAAPIAAPEAEARQARHGETVLVVDDEPAVRMLVSEVLAGLGYAVIEAADGAEALHRARTAPRIDLLITDVGLPGGMNGRQVADAARELRPSLLVLFITGYAENAVIRNGYLEPGMQVMSKPFALDALAAKVRSLIEAG